VQRSRRRRVVEGPIAATGERRVVELDVRPGVGRGLGHDRQPGRKRDVGGAHLLRAGLVLERDRVRVVREASRLGRLHHHREVLALLRSPLRGPGEDPQHRQCQQ
jgi:hypothetical protein